MYDSGNDCPRLAWEGAPGEPIPTPVTDPLSGSGTEEDPHVVSDINDFAFMNTASVTWDKHFLLTSDLDANGVDLRRAGLWPGVDFTGHFDGGGHIIGNLTIDAHDEWESSLGLFDRIGAEGHVTTVALENVSILTRMPTDAVGPVAGTSSGSVTHCWATGRTFARYAEVGGLIGCHAGTLSHCWADCEVSGDYDMGGLAGRSSHLITNGWAAGEIIVARGGLHLGALAGKSSSGFDSVTNSYFLKSNAPGALENGFGAALTDEQMKQRTSFVDWDFETV